jgi:transcriptional regulator with XRE-family HTH domain
MSAITPLQVKLGRTAVGLSVRELARAAGVSPTTVSRFELGHGEIHVAILARLQGVLEENGVVFVPADTSGSPTIRLKA